MGMIDWLLGKDDRLPPVSLTDQNFADEVLRDREPVLIDVWSPGCGPCKQLEPIIFDLRERYAGRVKVCELNVRAAPAAASRLQIRSTPTVVYLKKGRVLERVTGFRTGLYHREAIEELFGIPPEPA